MKDTHSGFEPSVKEHERFETLNSKCDRHPILLIQRCILSFELFTYDEGMFSADTELVEEESMSW